MPRPRWCRTRSPTGRGRRGPRRACRRSPGTGTTAGSSASSPRPTRRSPAVCSRRRRTSSPLELPTLRPAASPIPIEPTRCSSTPTSPTRPASRSGTSSPCASSTLTTGELRPTSRHRRRDRDLPAEAVVDETVLTGIVVPTPGVLRGARGAPPLRQQPDLARRPERPARPWRRRSRTQGVRDRRDAGAGATRRGGGTPADRHRPRRARAAGQPRRGGARRAGGATAAGAVAGRRRGAQRARAPSRGARSIIHLASIAAEVVHRGADRDRRDAASRRLWRRSVRSTTSTLAQGVHLDVTVAVARRGRARRRARPRRPSRSSSRGGPATIRQSSDPSRLTASAQRPDVARRRCRWRCAAVGGRALRLAVVATAGGACCSPAVATVVVSSREVVDEPRAVRRRLRRGRDQRVRRSDLGEASSRPSAART